MLEQTRSPFGAERLQSQILVAPLKKDTYRTGALPSRTAALPSRTAALPSRTAALPKYIKATEVSVTNLLKTPAGYNLKRVIEDLEKRRAVLFALALEAVAKAQEAQDRCQRAENRLEQVTNHQLVAEHQFRELLVKADQKRVEAEAMARAAEEKAHKIESIFLGEGEVTHKATERKLVFGLLMFANKGAGAIAHQATKKHKVAEARPRTLSEARESLAAIEQNSRGLKRANRIPEVSIRQLPKPVNDEYMARVTEQTDLGFKLKFIVYGMIIMLLLVGVFWMLTSS